MRITLTDASIFVITGRNTDLSEFYIRPKSDYLRQQQLGEDSFVLSSTEGVYSEGSIISMINEGIEFFTVNGNDFTPVEVIDGHLRTIPNDSKEDNLVNLPVMKA